ncbi:unnamed protein product [Withania somnifera]
MLRCMVRSTPTSWEDKLPLVEFAYNRSLHTSIGMTPFEVCYGFNPLIPITLTPLSSIDVIDLDAKKRAKEMIRIHAKAKETMERRVHKVAQKHNQGKKKVIFQPDDWVWVYFRKARFPHIRKGKLSPKGDGPFQVLERVNDNAYKVDLSESIWNSTTVSFRI